MAMTNVNPIFVDTNILVYAAVPASPFHTDASQRLLDLANAGYDFWISRQVIREYLAVLSRPQTFGTAIPLATAIASVELFEQQFRVANEDNQVTKQLISLLKAVPSGGKQIHDANLVATMIVNGMPAILTHNVADFTRFSGYIAVLAMIVTP